MFKRRLFAWILVIAVLLSLCPAAFATNDTDADSSEDTEKSTAVKTKRVRIYTAEQLQEFALECKMDSFSKNTVVYLEASIDLEKEPFDPFPSFSGTFEGKGHTISGFVNAEDGSNEGLFRYIEESGVVKDLNVIGTEVSNEGKTEIGGIAGTNYGLIENCSFTGIVSGKTMVGGICGSNYGRVVNCRCNGTVSGKTMVGGICGYNDGSVYSCLNRAKVNPKVWQNDGEDKDMLASVTENTKLDIASNIISANNANTTTDVGGICGYSDYIIYVCANYGTIGYPHYGYNVGGIAGRQSNFVSKCANYGAVYGRNDVGGIVGQNEPYMHLTDRASMSDEIQSLSSTFQNATDTFTGNAQMTSKIIEDVTEDTGGVLTATNDTLRDTGKLKKLEKDIKRDFGITADLDNIYDVQIIESDPNKQSIASKAGDKLVDAAQEAVSNPDITYSGIEKTAKEFGDAIEKDAKNTAKDGDIGNSSTVNAIKDTASDIGIDTEIDKKITDEAKGKASDKLGEDTVNRILDKNQQMTEEDVAKVTVVGVDSSVDWLSTHRQERKIQKQEQQDKIVDDITGGANSIVKMGEDYNALGKNIQTTINNLSTNFKEVNTHFTNVMNMLADALSGSLNVEVMKDVSEITDADSMFGTITGSVNNGIVEGDECVGGIAGAMGIESDFDLNGLISDTLASDGIFSNTYETTCIVRACENNGAINAKHDNLGGICGQQDIGLIISSENYGDITGTGNNNGGVVGLSYSTVNTCYSKCTVSGTDYVGGIAGSGSIIYDCMSLSNIPENDGSFVGAIAGYADMDAERQVEINSGISADAFTIVPGAEDDQELVFINEKCVSGNVFVSDELGGVKGVSYTYLAEPVSYKTAMDYSGLPEKLYKWEITFKADGKVVDTVEFEYGGSISELPEIPEKDGYSGFWEDFDAENLTASRIVNAVYIKNGNAVEGNAVRDNGRCVVLVEGAVHSESAVSVSFPEELAKDRISGKKISEAVSVKLSEQQTENEEYLIHYNPVKKNADKIYVLTDDGQWHRVKSEQEGSYIVFHSSAPVTFAAVTTSHAIWIVIICAAAALALAGGYFLYKEGKLVRRKSNQSTEA